MRQNQRFSNSTILQSFSKCTHQMLTSIVFMTLLAVSNTSFAAQTCPGGDEMFYVGADSQNIVPENNKLPLSWSGLTGTGSSPRAESSTIYTFANNNNIKLTLSFSDMRFLKNTSPAYKTNSTVTKNAIEMSHTSPYALTNHKLTATIDRPVTKYGFIVQDADANDDSKYIESVSIVSPTGSFSNLKTSFSKLSNASQTVSGIKNKNCSPGETTSCDFNIDWSTNSKLKSIPFVITHGNPHLADDKAARNGEHIIGYSDFYFCLTPPKLTVIKKLDDIRFNDTYEPTTKTQRDQFEISINNVAAPIIKTSGSGQDFNSNSNISTVLSLSENTTYTISERVTNGSTNGSTFGDIENYNATYICNNTTAGSTTVMPTAAMTYNATDKTRSFTLSNVTYGDEITCTVTNTPSAYTFSGTVFNDNGGLTLEANKVGVVNSAYFNGKFDSTSGEIGVSDSNLTISLTDCSEGNTPITNTSPQLVPSTGKYVFNVPRSSLQLGQTVCLVENEPVEWEYSVDTTTNRRNIIITNGKYVYDNIDFGEVKANNSALVLIKSQYVHDCNATLNYSDSAINQTTDNPRIGFSDKPVSDVAPNQCIAYRIEAYNRGHVELKDVQIRDELTSNKSSFTNPTPKGVPINIYGTTMPTAKVITSNKFNLAGASSSATKATLYFNTKYGTTVDP